jgi:hypothetical protein
MWLAIRNVILIWDFLKEVLTWNKPFFFLREDEETISHFLRKCSYEKQVWREFE